jgi:hypothetical protein
LLETAWGFIFKATLLQYPVYHLSRKAEQNIHSTAKKAFAQFLNFSQSIKNIPDN